MSCKNLLQRGVAGIGTDITQKNRTSGVDSPLARNVLKAYATTRLPKTAPIISCLKYRATASVPAINAEAKINAPGAVNCETRKTPSIYFCIE